MGTVTVVDASEDEISVVVVDTVDVVRVVWATVVVGCAVDVEVGETVDDLVVDVIALVVSFPIADRGRATKHSHLHCRQGAQPVVYLELSQ